MEREKEDGRERTERKRRETDRDVKKVFIACASLISAQAYRCGLVVRVHPASSAAISLQFPKTTKNQHRVTTYDATSSLTKESMMPVIAICHPETLSPKP